MEGGGSFWGVDGLVDVAICCPQLAVATPMGFQILTLFDNVSVELYPWLRVCVCVCVGRCDCVVLCMGVCVCVRAR